VEVVLSFFARAWPTSAVDLPAVDDRDGVDQWVISLFIGTGLGIRGLVEVLVVELAMEELECR